MVGIYLFISTMDSFKTIKKQEIIIINPDVPISQFQPLLIDGLAIFYIT